MMPVTDNRSGTIAGQLAWAAERLRDTSSTPRLDAELLLAHTLGWGRARLLAESRMPLSAPQLAAFGDLVARRAALEPVAYLLGHKEFYGLDFVVDRRVLVPRPETELLMELALAEARQTTRDERPKAADGQALVLGRSSLVVADIGTGSGCIAVALATHLPEATFLAVDISPDALAVARENAERHGVSDRVRLVQGDLLDALDGQVDMIVSNPPYTVLAEIDEGVRRHEPRGALDGGLDGLDAYRRLIAQAPARLRRGGALLLEIGATQGLAVAELGRQHFPDADIRVHQDLAGLDRVIAIQDRETGRQGDQSA